jgi:hypothetical protein
MSRANFFLLVRLALAAVVLLALQSCENKPSKSEQRVEKPVAIATPQPSPAASATPLSKLPPPTQAEVDAAFSRAFGSDLLANTASSTSYIVGDFNGDGSEDLAVIARPAKGKLDEINSELANWILMDADKAFIPPSSKSVVVPPRQERPRIAPGEEVLAIIHGFGPQGWRSPDARQAYIVKHAGASFLGTAPSASQKAIRAMHLPVETDIIKQVRNTRKGFLFWTGGVYAWHPGEA